MGVMGKQRYPQGMELLEAEFEQLLALVDVLDSTQLLRLYCKVASRVGDRGQESAVVAAVEGDTIPPKSE